MRGKIMNFSIGKIIFFLTLLCTVAFAGGIEEDSGPEEINNEMTDKTQWKDENFPKLIDLLKYKGQSGMIMTKFGKTLKNFHL